MFDLLARKARSSEAMTFARIYVAVLMLSYAAITNAALAQEANGAASNTTGTEAAAGRHGFGPPWLRQTEGENSHGPDAMFAADREIFHSLLEDHAQVRRTVTKREDGVETVTESDDPNVALAIQGHVAAMHRRLQKRQPIRLRDPLFAALFGQAAEDCHDRHQDGQGCACRGSLG